LSGLFKPGGVTPRCFRKNGVLGGLFGGGGGAKIWKSDGAKLGLWEG